MNKFLLASLLGGFICLNHAAGAANVISDSEITINAPVSDEEAAKINTNRRWHATSVILGATADEAAFASLQKIPEVRNLTISYSNKTITSLDSIALAPHLVSLHFSGRGNQRENPLSLAPLANCPELTTLVFFSTYLKDVEALAACTQLRSIDFTGTEVASLEFLRSTPLVESLILYGTDRTPASYEPVSSLKNLRELRMNQLNVAVSVDDVALASLAKLTNLRKFHLGSAKNLRSLNFLANCRDMEELGIYYCKELVDISAVRNMPYLTKVQLEQTGLQKIEALGGKPYITGMSLVGTPVQDLSPLKDSIQLDHLNLTGSAVTDLSPLAGMRMLTILTLQNTRVQDLGPLKNLPHLHVLSLDSTAVTDLTPLAHLEELHSIDIERTAVTDLRPLQSITTLTRLELYRTVPNDQIEALKAALPNLLVVLPPEPKKRAEVGH